MEQDRRWSSTKGSCSFFSETQLAVAVNTLPSVLMSLHDVFMREDVGAARTAFQVTQCVIFTGIGLNDLEINAVAVSAGMFHEL